MQECMSIRQSARWNLPSGNRGWPVLGAMVPAEFIHEEGRIINLCLQLLLFYGK